MDDQSPIRSEARLTFLEATSIIIGHGVGSGILAIPFLASRNSFRDVVLVLLAAYAVNLLMHLMIAELSLNNGGAQFIKCFEKELFTGKGGKAVSWAAFGFLALSVLVNVCGFLTGASMVFTSWFGWAPKVSMLVYYVFAAGVVYAGMKVVGVCEKIAVMSMVGVIGLLFVAAMLGERFPIPSRFIAGTNVLALYGMVSFSLSAVMSVPQVVKGVGGNVKKIRAAIAAGTGVNLALIFIVTLMTLIGVGGSITQNGALVDLSGKLGGWVSVVGYVFTLLALSTSFWANTLNLRDIIHEQTRLGNHTAWLIATLPCLLLALLGLQSFVGFTRLASVVQVLTGVGIILSYSRSRKKHPEALICGKWGTPAFRILVILSTLIATAGAVLPVK